MSSGYSCKLCDRFQWENTSLKMIWKKRWVLRDQRCRTNGKSYGIFLNCGKTCRSSLPWDRRSAYSILQRIVIQCTVPSTCNVPVFMLGPVRQTIIRGRPCSQGSQERRCTHLTIGRGKKITLLGPSGEVVGTKNTSHLARGQRELSWRKQVWK